MPMKTDVYTARVSPPSLHLHGNVVIINIVNVLISISLYSVLVLIVSWQWRIQTLSDGGANRFPSDSKFASLCVFAYYIRQAKLTHKIHVSF